MADLIIKPLVNEKSARMEDESVFVFKVAACANKIEVASAIETAFGVKVVDVRTLCVRGKYRRGPRGSSRQGHWKKAYVRLAPGSKISFLES